MRHKVLFEPGRIVATLGAIKAISQANQQLPVYLRRHLAGDWGQVSAEDARENDISLQAGFRILSAYTLNTGAKVWIITEADRSATTILLPEEY